MLRFAIVKLSVPSPDKVTIWKFPLWDLRFRGKHYSEINLLCDEKQSFMLGHIEYDHGNNEALQII